jgi:hypothetical protein
MIGVIFKNWGYIVLTVIFFSLGAYISFKIQGIKIDKLKVEKRQIELELSQCAEANKVNKETIDNLTQDIKNANQLCLKRMRIKDQTFKKIQLIDKIERGTDEANTGDDLLDALDGMFK